MAKINKKAKPKSLLFRLKLFNKKKLFILGIISSIFIALFWIFWQLPLSTDLENNEPVSTKLFDRNGKLIYEIYEEKRRSPIPLKDIPKFVKEATIAIEDKDFYSHHGVSVTGMIRALRNTLFQGNLQGGSTLTQQLVKNSLLTPERTVRRKIRELILTFAVEARYSKDQILESYLNEIPYGSTAYGIEAASELYFGKSAKDLDLAQSSLLAGLLQSPTQYSPFGTHPELAKERQTQVLDRMVEEKYITKDEAQKAKDEELHFAEAKAPQAPHFALWVKELLAQKYGDAVVEKGGLRVTTTLDLDLQKFAEDTVATEVARLKNQKVGNGAALITIPKTGEILAMVGSKDYFAKDTDGKVNIIFAKRQPGSSIKPLNYALALKDHKITLASPLADVPTCFNEIGQESYCPVNYDEKFHGIVQTRFALGNSYNIPAVRVLALNGVENFINFAKSTGITTFTDPKNYGLSLTLGGGEVMPYDMATAFSVFANQGIKEPLFPILKVEDWKGNVLEENKPKQLEGDRILNPDITFLISHTLLDNNARVAAFGDSSYLIVPGHPEVSVKTGTTNDRRDNWTIGYTSQILAVTWVGNNDYTPMSGAVSGVSGASPIWNRIIKQALDKAEKGYYDPNDKGHSWPKQPEDVIGLNVCATTGNVPQDKDHPDCPTRFEYFQKDNIPSQGSTLKQDIQIDKTLQTLTSSKTPPDQIITENHPVIYDPLKTLVCLNCNLPTEPVIINYPIR
ncbi:MAG: penicillin-binding protein [Candidatus Woesebacteria bacterium]|nr:MAG: penicillin-binding protein [Candidatus Woesebacteria bacterium]